MSQAKGTQGHQVSAVDPPAGSPAIELNRETMARYRSEMRRYYDDPSKYRTNLDQLGIDYPTERAADGNCPGKATP